MTSSTPRRWVATYDCVGTLVHTWYSDRSEGRWVDCYGMDGTLVPRWHVVVSPHDRAVGGVESRSIPRNFEVTTAAWAEHARSCTPCSAAQADLAASTLPVSALVTACTQIGSNGTGAANSVICRLFRRSGFVLKPTPDGGHRIFFHRISSTPGEKAASPPHERAADAPRRSARLAKRVAR